MTLTPAQCIHYIDSLAPRAQAEFLALLGHQLTVAAREAYEVRGPGVTNPRWLRDLNEISHRLFPQIAALTAGKPAPFLTDALVEWITAEGNPELSKRGLVAFERAMHYAHGT